VQNLKLTYAHAQHFFGHFLSGI